MKHWPNVITALRIAASIGLLFCNVTGLLLFLTVPAMFWSIIPIAIVVVIATFAAVQGVINNQSFLVVHGANHFPQI